MKASQFPDQSVLQTTSSSLGFPKGILQRHALSLGSGKGFGRTSPAGGVLDHLQMPNKVGLKFPSRDFGRVSKTLSAIPLTPKLSLPSKPASPRAASPAPPAAAKAAALTAAEPPAAEVAATEAISQPEPRRLPHSRFTEEYLRPIVPDRRAEPSRAELVKKLELEQPPQHLVDIAEAGTQYSDEESDSAAELSEPVTVETQTSTLSGQIESDPALPVYGFRRHMSLREPDTLLHPRLGRPIADDIITTAQPRATELQRRATTDFMLDAISGEESESGGMSQQLSVVTDQAVSEAAAQQAQNESSTIDSALSAPQADSAADMAEYESDLVGDLVKTLSMAADDDYSMDADTAVDGTLERVTTDVATADALDQEEAASTTMASLTTRVTEEHDGEQITTVETIVTSVTEQTEAADGAEQLTVVATVVDGLRAQSAEHYERSDSLAVIEAVDGVQSDAADNFSSQGLATVDEALGELTDEIMLASEAEQAATTGNPFSENLFVLKTSENTVSENLSSVLESLVYILKTAL